MEFTREMLKDQLHLSQKFFAKLFEVDVMIKNFVKKKKN
jgi:hypothetical protein